MLWVVLTEIKFKSTLFLIYIVIHLCTEIIVNILRKLQVQIWPQIWQKTHKYFKLQNNKPCLGWPKETKVIYKYIKQPFFTQYTIQTEPPPPPPTFFFSQCTETSILNKGSLQNYKNLYFNVGSQAKTVCQTENGHNSGTYKWFVLKSFRLMLQ